MQLNDFLEKLESRGLGLVNNQSIADSMAINCDTHSLVGPPPGAESLISGAFTSSMPEACNAPNPEDLQQTVTFDLPTTPRMS